MKNKEKRKDQKADMPKSGSDRQGNSSGKNKNPERNEQNVSGTRRNPLDRSAGLSSKSGVTGSDSDGQVAE